MGSNPTPRTKNHTTKKLFEFGGWLRKTKGNRISTVERKIKHLRSIFVHVDLVKAVGKQLEVLEAYGLVEFTGKGWRWKG